MSDETLGISSAADFRPLPKPGTGTEPIAIVGVAFRFPGDISDENEFWQALCERRDLVTAIPETRWAVDALKHPRRSEPGRSVTFAAGVLSTIDQFDAGFFGISPREAAVLDPQQRLLLELSWEALENSGISPTKLRGTDGAVLVGISGIDYGARSIDDLSSMSSNSMTGNTLSIAANRLSYFFDLHGPSMAVDTACSSSLVAIHQACTLLRSGEAPFALVGGVNLLLHPYPFVGFSKASMLSAQGRCKAFDASGDGYVRAEGGAVVLLKPLSSAIADGDPVQAIILASGVNTDGGRKTGLTVPSSAGQAELMRTVLSRAGIQASDLAFFEAHGTGTPVGDPIEAAAIGGVYGQGRETLLPVGSVKANLGHLESASGMAGLVKVMLALKHRSLPPALHLQEPNPHIDFSALKLQLVDRVMPLHPPAEAPLVAGLNNFGFGGANAHLLVQEPPAPARLARNAEPPSAPLFLSARSPKALRELASRYADKIAVTSTAALYDMCYSAAFRRARLEHRLMIGPGSPEEVASRLSAFSQEAPDHRFIVEESLPGTPEIAFVYSGNGSQWHGMARRLAKESPRFAELLSAVASQVSVAAGFSVGAELLAGEDPSRLDVTEIAQPLLFAIQVAITQWLREQGIAPKAVTGHSVGEVAAAWAAGLLSLKQAIRVICERSKAQGMTRGSGRMAVASLSADVITPLLDLPELEGGVELAGINSPVNVTISGSLVSLEKLGERLGADGVSFRLLDLDYAFHSKKMDDLQPMLLANLQDLSPSASSDVKFVSTVTGHELNGAALDAGYWWRNVRMPVRFADAVDSLVRLGCGLFIEVAPHAILQGYIRETLSGVGARGRVLPTLTKHADGIDRLNETLYRAYLLAGEPDLSACFPIPAPPVRLPNYPWQRERHWHPVSPESPGTLYRRIVHPLLGWRVPGDQLCWENSMDTASHPGLKDHRLGEAVVFPGAGYVEMALAAAREWLGSDTVSVEDMDISSPLVLENDHAHTLRLTINADDGSFRIQGKRRLGEEPWTLLVSGRLLLAPQITLISPIAFPDASACIREMDGTEHYELTSLLGLNYGPSFRKVSSLRIAGDVIEGYLCQASSEHEGHHPLDDSALLLHPAILDACYQSLLAFFADDVRAGRGVAMLPVRVGRLSLHSREKVATFRTSLSRRGARSVVADIDLFDISGKPVAYARGCRFKASPSLLPVSASPARWRIMPKLRPHPSTLRTSVIGDSFDHAGCIFGGFSLAGSRRRVWFEEALPMIEALTLGFAFEAFEAVARESDLRLQDLVDQHDPWTDWLIALLRRENLILGPEGGWRLGFSSELPTARSIWQTLIRDEPACLPQLSMLGHVGMQLPDILRGHKETKAVLQSLQASPASETIYNDDPAYLGTRLACEQLLQQLSRQLPENTQLRVLEIVDGPTDLPRALLSTPLGARLHYVVAQTDGSTFEIQRNEYRHVEAVSVAEFNREAWDFTDIACCDKFFDIIIVRHVLHRTALPDVALIRTRSWIASGGLLVIAERYPDWSADFVGGLDPHWWRSPSTHETSISGPASCLRDPESWLRTLGDAGIDGLSVFVEPECTGRAMGAYLIAGRVQVATDTAVPPQPAPAQWLLLTDHASDEIAGRLVERIGSLGLPVAVERSAAIRAAQDDVTTAHNPMTCAPRIVRVNESQGADVQPMNIVFMRGWERAMDEATEILGEILSITQSFSARPEGHVKLWMVTRGGALACGAHELTPTNPAQTALWGFGRVVMNEHPELGCTLIDTPGGLPVNVLAERLAVELLWPDGVEEIVLDMRSRYSLQMTDASATLTRTADESVRFRLDFPMLGQLRELKWMPAERVALADDEIEIHVHATGLNFRDVMYSMGLLPEEAVEDGFAGATLGLECAGVITRVGTSVKDFRPGDSVMGLGRGCFASHVITRADAVAAIPEGWTFESAATVPSVFLTTYYALKHLACIQPGETILIHGAAGGVGMAALQIASYLGASIYATAGTEVKRDLVRLLGADKVFSSRDPNFADEVLAATGGQGVDVVLNSLAGEAMRRSLRILRPFGRFLELGKRDFFENSPVGLRPFKDNISYFGIDADRLMTGRPRIAAAIFREVMDLLRQGVLSPLPLRRLDADRVVEAFRTMQQGRHVGKLVVGMDKVRMTAPVAQRLFSEGLSGDRSWLVTGGFDGLGRETARWLVSRGVRHLILLGRRGSDTPGADALLDELRRKDAQVLALACNVTDAGQVGEAIAEASRRLPPLAGIVHAAASFDDKLIAGLSEEAIRAVIGPKLQGALNLHRATIDTPLDYFVLYSSLTTYLGSPGQANYVAANAGLEGLAEMRRHLGLPAECISWGAIGDCGYLARNQSVRDSLQQKLGRPALTAPEVMQQLDHVLGERETSLLIADFDWSILARWLPSASAERFTALNRAREDKAGIDESADIRAVIAGKSGAEALQIIRELVIHELAEILCISPERIAPDRPMHDLGLDSLMSVELMLGLERRVGIRLPVMMINESPTVERIAARLVETVRTGGAGSSDVLADQASGTVIELARQHGEQVTEEDIMSLAQEVRSLADSGVRISV